MSSDRSEAGFTRRQILRGLAAVGVASAGPPTRLLAAKSANNAVIQENQRPSTRDWMLRETRIDPESRYRSPWIESYCSHRSVCAGDIMSFHVSTNPASPFTLDIYRTGHYVGNGGRLVKQLGEFSGKSQPEPPVGPKRLRHCEWETFAELQIPQDWLSGVYLGKLTALASGLQSYVIFIVRDDRPADSIFQCSNNTNRLTIVGLISSRCTTTANMSGIGVEMSR